MAERAKRFVKTRRWRVLPAAPKEQLATLAMTTDGDILLAQLLYNRGITNSQEAQLFLSAGEALSHDPFLMNDMDKAVQRIIRSLIAEELIAVYGDYDADGVTGSVLLAEVLSYLGGRCRPYIPRRIEEGYGLSVGALDALFKAGVKLVIAVDCGTNAVEEARFAQREGVDLIIADHHTVGPDLPATAVLLNPKRADSTYPFRQLASVGVAFKLAQALLRSCDGRMWPSSSMKGVDRPVGIRQTSVTHAQLREDDLLDLVVLGTVADMVPLVGENRYLVKRGLEVINTTNRVGIQQMAQRSGATLGSISAGTIGYVLGPRLNAAGRLGDAILSYRLLAARDALEARRLAEALEEKNAERQRLTVEAVDFACEEVHQQGEGSPLLISCSQSYVPGILGLVAGRLVDLYYKPAVVIEEAGALCRGSARSIPEFDIVAALGECSDTLVQFGGHAQAAGFTVKREDISRLRERLIELANVAIGGVNLSPSLRVDAEVPLSAVTGRTFSLLNQCAPFGLGNPVPTLLSRGVRVLDGRAVGAQGDHLRLRLSDGRVAWPAIAFGLGGLAGSLSDLVDVVYSLEENVWNGERLVQMRVSDLHACV